MTLKDWKKDYDKVDMFGYENKKIKAMVEGVRIGHKYGPWIWSINYSSSKNPRLHIGQKRTKQAALKFAKSYMKKH
jgi:hypothetical protein